MFAYRTPGVRFEWLDVTTAAVLPYRTDIAGFVGIAARGPLHRPVRIESWNQFTSIFGAHTTQGFLAYAVQGFFANGGQTCWVVRAADPDWARCASLDIIAESFNGRKLRLTATSPGVWSHQLRVTVLLQGRRFSLILRLPDGTQEVWRDLTLDEYEANPRGQEPNKEARFVEKLLNPLESDAPDASSPQSTPPSGSQLVRAEVLSRSESGAQATLDIHSGDNERWLAGGADGIWTLAPEHLSGNGAPADATWGLATLEKVPEIGIVAIPDIMPAPVRRPQRPKPRPLRCEVLDTVPEPPPYREEADPDHPPPFSEAQIRALQHDLVGHCERLKNRVAILDARVEDRSPQAVAGWRRAFDSAYAALYWPWVRMPDPLAAGGQLLAVPPSGHVAGIYARVDWQIGVHKPPANELIEAARDVTAIVDDVQHGYLNDKHVNVMRAYPGRGLRVAGARTLSSDPMWRYVNVRRLLIMIERAIETQSQWLVFEPNNPALWRDVERIIRAFLDGLWQRGMLDGATAAEAYSVTSDETSNTAGGTEMGRLVAEIGVRPPPPAEFVVVRIGKTESGTQILEGTEGGNASVRRP